MSCFNSFRTNFFENHKFLKRRKPLNFISNCKALISRSDMPRDMRTSHYFVALLAIKFGVPIKLSVHQGGEAWHGTEFERKWIHGTRSAREAWAGPPIFPCKLSALPGFAVLPQTRADWFIRDQHAAFKSYVRIPCKPYLYIKLNAQIGRNNAAWQRCPARFCRHRCILWPTCSAVLRFIRVGQPFFANSVPRSSALPGRAYQITTIYLDGRFCWFL